MVTAPKFDLDGFKNSVFSDQSHETVFNVQEQRHVLFSYVRSVTNKSIRNELNDAAEKYWNDNRFRVHWDCYVADKKKVVACLLRQRNASAGVDAPPRLAVHAPRAPFVAAQAPLAADPSTGWYLYALQEVPETFVRVAAQPLLLHDGANEAYGALCTLWIERDRLAVSSTAGIARMIAATNSIKTLSAH